uniref:Uncharacterized protein n=1 Tax=Photinus pyralis TaxID=7054 RepID=A0A1Y1NDF8_PHOPY
MKKEGRRVLEAEEESDISTSSQEQQEEGETETEERHGEDNNKKGRNNSEGEETTGWRLVKRPRARPSPGSGIPSNADIPVEKLTFSGRKSKFWEQRLRQAYTKVSVL